MDLIKKDNMQLALSTAGGRKAPKPKPRTASDLPRTCFSDFLEKRVAKRVYQARKKEAKRRNVRWIDVPKPGKITIRVVSCLDKEHYAHMELEKLYSESHGYPKAFPFRQKCVLVFEHQDGVDMLIFALFIQSYGADCPPPNTRSIYIAYLDSVKKFFKVKFIRSLVYQEILISTLHYERKRGIVKAAIWSCAPADGDDYIFHCHPADEKYPKAERLVQWYLRLLDDARREGVVISITEMYKEYFGRVSDITKIPTYDVDFWPTRAGNLLKEWKHDTEGDPKKMVPLKVRTSKRGGASAKKKGKDKASKKAPKRKTNNSASATFVAPAPEKKSAKAKGKAKTAQDDGAAHEDDTKCSGGPKKAKFQDALTAKLATHMFDMRKDFIVVKMHHQCSKCDEEFVKPKQKFWLIGDWIPSKDKSNLHAKPKAEHPPPYALCVKCYEEEFKRLFDGKDEKLPSNEKLDVKYRASDASRRHWSVVSHAYAAALAKKQADASPKPTRGKAAAANAAAAAAAKAAEVEEKKKRQAEELAKIEIPSDLDEAMNNMAYHRARLINMEYTMTSIRETTSDPDPTIECDILNSREKFLSLCEGNHYQFDELRRSKHSSMMVVYHLLNPDLPAFNVQCNVCKKEEISGVHYHCEQEGCDYDICESCYKKTSTPKHEHELKKVDPLKDSNNGGQNASVQKKNVQLHMKLLQHAASCRDPGCKSTNCTKMKALLKHGAKCETRATGGCRICRRIWALLQIHARQCRLPHGQCKVPRCADLKTHLRKLAQQQADRRVRNIMSIRAGSSGAPQQKPAPPAANPTKK